MVRLGPGMAVREVLSDFGVEVLGEAAGWGLARARKRASADLAARVASAIGQPAISGWIFDSDFAYVTGTGRDGYSFEALFGEPYPTNGDDGYQLGLERLSSPSGRRDSANALSTWSETSTPTRMTPETAS